MTNLERLMLVMLIIALILTCISLILAISANAKYRRLYRQYDYFMRGKDAENLEDYFVDLQKHVERLEDEEQNNKDMFRILNRNIRSSFQRFGLIRYNAFGGIGGNQSFAMALLDYTNSGFVLNSVYSREGCFLYIKDVEAGSTEVELGAEERLALEQALGYREKAQQ